MKITDFILAFMIIAFPIFYFLEQKAIYTLKFTQINQQHKGALTNATLDAVHVLRTNVVPENEESYVSDKIHPIDPDIAFKTFLYSLSTHYQVYDEVYSIDSLARYVPVFAVVDYNGLLLNVYQEIVHAQKGKSLERVWLPKVPFSHADVEGNVINFTTDSEYVEVYDANFKEWYWGKKADLITNYEITVPLLENANAVDFEQIRRQTIVNTIQKQIAYYINEHNVYKKQLDVTYQFALPLIPQEDWYNTVDDIGIITFFQGYPFRYQNDTFQEYAFTGTRLTRKDVVQAGIVDGKKRYWYQSCHFPHKVEELYNAKKNAAKAGYRELSCLNP